MSRRVTAVAWIVVVLLAIVGLNEPLRGMFEGTVDFAWPGYAAFVALGIAAIQGVILVLRARRVDPTFRGPLSELAKLTAIAEALILLSAWAFYLGD